MVLHSGSRWVGKWETLAWAVASSFMAVATIVAIAMTAPILMQDLLSRSDAAIISSFLTNRVDT